MTDGRAIEESSRRLGPGRALLIATLIAAAAGAWLHPLGDRAFGEVVPAKSDPEKAAWERQVVLFGDEETSDWSLRVNAAFVKQRTTFVLDQLWKLDPENRQWSIVDKSTDIHTLVPAAERHPDPGDDETREMAAPLSYITKGMLGVFYAKWTVDGRVHGGTFVRLGPDAAKRRPNDSSKAPKGFMWTAVPLNLNKAEEMLIPDPRIACAEGDEAATQPAK